MRMTAETFVRALLRRCQAEGAYAQIVRHGDDHAGAVYVKASRLDGTAALYGPAPAGLAEPLGDRRFTVHIAAGSADAVIEDALRRHVEFDPDLWLVEIEDRDGRHFLDDWLMRAA